MPNILINPNSGIMEFTTGTAGASSFNTILLAALLLIEWVMIIMVD